MIAPERFCYVSCGLPSDQCDCYRKSLAHIPAKPELYAAELAAKDAEIARLREALNAVIEIAHRQEIEALYPDDMPGLEACIDDMATTARAALGDADAWGDMV